MHRTHTSSRGVVLLVSLGIAGASAACNATGDLKEGFAPPPADTAVTRLVIQPSSVRLTLQDSIQFIDIGLTDAGDTLPASVDWSATGGTIRSNGMYVATAEGMHRVTARGRGVGWGPGGRNRADTSVVTVVPPVPTLVGVDLTPSSVSVQTGATQQFAATGRMSDGSSTGVTVDFSATGGAVSPTGLYAAGSTPGSFRVIALETMSGLADTAAVTVTSAPPPAVTAVILTPATVSLDVGGTQQFVATGRYSDGTTGAVAVSYTATGGTITAGGQYTAGSSAGTFRVIAVQQGGSLADTSTVTITVPAPTLTSITLQPPTATLLIGGTRQFAVAGQYSDGSTGPVSVTYSATGGTIASNGLYAAGNNAGTFRVVAVQQGGTLADTSQVTINTPPTLTGVVLSPASTSLLPGGTRQFSVTGQFSDGSTGLVSVTYSATGGTISGGGLYTAGTTPGSFRVIAVQLGGTLADTSNVTITSPPTLTQVILTPPSATLQPGANQSFSTVGQFSDGSTGAISVTYNATGGTITTGGVYTAGSTPGSYRVIAVVQGGTLADTAAVTVSAPPPPGSLVISAEVRRFASGTGSVLVSSGVPLPPGTLFPNTLGNVRVMVNGVEQAIYIEGLQGLHPDGSLRSILIQFPSTVGGTPVAAQVELGTVRGTSDLAKTPVTWDMPAGALLPTSPAYLVTTDLVGPTRPTSQSSGIFATADQYFLTWADWNWNTYQGEWTNSNYYDRVWNHYGYWVRSANVVYWQRATVIAINYRRGYLEAGNYASSPHWSQLEGLLLHYWLTGDERSKTAVIETARILNNSFTVASSSDPSYQYNEGRIQARTMLACLLAHRLGDQSRNWGAQADGYINAWINLQQPDGSFDYRLNTEDPASAIGQSNFMEGLRLDAMIKYYRYRSADPRVVTMVQKQVDYLWNTQWDQPNQAFHYWDVWSLGDANVPLATEAFLLNDLMAIGFAFTYAQTGIASYRTNGDAAVTRNIQAGPTNFQYGGGKQFNQAYYTLWNYIGYHQ